MIPGLVNVAAPVTERKMKDYLGHAVDKTTREVRFLSVSAMERAP